MPIPNAIIRHCDLFRQELHKALKDWCVLAGYRGSIAHGMFVPSTDPNSIDDKDLMAVVVPPPEIYLGLNQFGHKGNGTMELAFDEWDLVVYDLRKIVSLLAKGNPNVLSLLWLNENYYLEQSFAGRELIKNRDLFANRSVYNAFTGYAHGQLKKMTNATFEGYMGQKRKGLVEKFGYDTKNAAHLIRLLRMGIEFLRDGELYVEREDAAELLAIKRGEWKLERVQEKADQLFGLAQEALLHSNLPKQPDMERINHLLVRLIIATWAERGQMPVTQEQVRQYLVEHKQL